jgi:ribose 5-phosphate isomerase A
MGDANVDASDEQARAAKLAAARAAAAMVPEGAVVGLGSGSTAELMIQELAARVRQGLRIRGVPTSERTRELAARLGIALLDLNDAPPLDMSIDGADEVALPRLDLIKGRGGALLREKLVAASSRLRIIIVDASKLVTTLGERHPLPVEVVPFGWAQTARRLAALGCRPALRMAPGSAREATGQAAPYLTDGDHYILDCATGPIADPAALAQAIKAQVGVVEHGLFVGMAERVVAGDPTGVRVYDRQG